MREKFLMCYSYLFKMFIDDTASTGTFQQKNIIMNDILRFVHETLTTNTIDMTPIIRLYYNSILVEYHIDCSFSAIITSPSISTLIFQIINQQ